MKRNKTPYDIVCEAAEHPGHENFVVTGTLQLMDENGVPVEYVSGPALQQAVRQVFTQVYGPVNQERIRRFEAIEDFTLRPELLDLLTAAIVEPLMEGFRREHARLLHLANQALRHDLVEMQPGLWWTPTAIRKLRKDNPDYREEHFGAPFNRTIAMTNYLCYHYVSRNVPRELVPFGDDEASTARYERHGRTLRRLLHGVLASLVE